jgi:transmembrane sensor
MGREIEAIQQTASDWLAQCDAGPLTADDEARFEAWLNESTLHRVEYLRLEAAWQETRRLKALAAGISGDRPPPAGQWNLSPFFEEGRLSSSESAAEAPSERPRRPEPARPASTRIRRAWALAASVLLIVAGALLAWNLWPIGQQYSTPVGGIASVPMSDGSQVTLNTNSQVRIALSASERHVDLQQGEAFFQVAHDAHRPFVVDAGKRRVIAVGTQFSVRREGDAIQVVVTEGKVRIEDVRPSGSATPAHAEEPVFLSPGTVARAGDSGLLVQRKTISEAEDVLSWRSGTLTFRDETLADAIAEFNRYSERPVVIDDPAVAARKIEGNFRSNNVAAFLELLQGGYPVQVTEEPDRYVIRAK